MSSAWLKYSKEEKEQVFAFAKEYENFISTCKNERLCVDYAVEKAVKAGYKTLEEYSSLKAGDKVIVVNRGKGLALFTIGNKPLTEGLRILGAHIDSPRLDLKQHPLYEKDGFALLDTHYYGGVKKYQWVTIPLALVGVVCKKDGTTVNVNIGDGEDDPVVGITDLLIHLSQKQLQLTAAEVISGENLDVLVANTPVEDDEKDAVKKYVLSLLKEKYGIEEDDFISAEIEVVPAGKARDFGLDKRMIAGYGHDDRCCAYTSLMAELDMPTMDYTTCCYLVDKEEIGSVGSTGAHSFFFENAVGELLAKCGDDSFIAVRRTLANSKMLSSDVSAAVDPMFGEAFEVKNSAYMSHGIVFNKYTGSRGKSGCNDAHPEFLAKIREVLDRDNVSFQTAELGRVDLGGGGTIAYIMANYNMDVVDSGIAVLNMHAPMEIISKADLYEAYRCYKSFLTIK